MQSVFRRAEARDLTAIIAMLADDVLGSGVKIRQCL